MFRALIWPKAYLPIPNIYTIPLHPYFLPFHSDHSTSYEKKRFIVKYDETPLSRFIIKLLKGLMRICISPFAYGESIKFFYFTVKRIIFQATLLVINGILTGYPPTYTHLLIFQDFSICYTAEFT